MHLFAGTILALIATQAPAPAQPVPSAAFSAFAVIVSDPNQFVKEWSQPGDHVAVHATAEARPGQQVTAFVIHKNCRLARDGACHVKATFQVVGPDGRPTPLRGSFTVASQSPPSPGLVARSEQAPTLAFGNDSRPGRYRVQIAVTDEGDPTAPVVLHREVVLNVGPRPADRPGSGSKPLAK